MTTATATKATDNQNRPDWQPVFSPWRHGGWYVDNLRYPSGAVGCVSRNYDDRKWRIACDPRPFDERPTFPNRTAAAFGERDLIAQQAAASNTTAAPETPRGNLVCGAPLMGRTCLERGVDAPCLNCRAWLRLKDAANPNTPGDSGAATARPHGTTQQPRGDDDDINR